MLLCQFCTGSNEQSLNVTILIQAWYGGRRPQLELLTLSDRQFQWYLLVLNLTVGQSLLQRLQALLRDACSRHAFAEDKRPSKPDAAKILQPGQCRQSSVGDLSPGQ